MSNLRQPGRNILPLWPILAVAAVFMSASWFWVYRGGFGEGDSMSMAAGIFQARLKGTGLFEPLLNIVQFHPFYEAAFVYAPQFLISSVGSLIVVMNFVSWIAAGAVLVFLGLGLRSLGLGLNWIVVLMMVLAADGVFFEAGTYGHPIMPALALTAIATWLLLKPSHAALIAGIILLECSLGVRLDIVLLWPGMIALIWLRHGRSRFALAATAAICVAFVHILAIGGIFSRDPNQRLLIGQMFSFLHGSYRPALIVDGVVKSVLDAGPGLVALFIGVLIAGLRKRRVGVGAAIVALAWVLPPWLAHLGNPTPARHFLYLAFGLVWATAILSGGGETTRFAPKHALILALVVAANLGSHWVTGPIAHRMANRLRPEIVTRLSESVFSRHRTNQAYLDWDRIRWDAELKMAADGQLYVGAWREIGGLLLAACRAGVPVTRDGAVQDAGSVFWRMRIGGKRVDFLEWYPGRPPTPADQRAVTVVHPYPPAELARFGAARLSVPPDGLSFEYW